MDNGRAAWLKEKMGLFRDKCRENGLKITPQRLGVYEQLLLTEEHPSAEVVYRKVRRKFPNISLDTVNRTLLTLADIGAAFIVEGSGDPKRFDARTESHRHCRCIKCKKIRDFEHEDLNGIKLPQDMDGDFQILRTVVYVEGICGNCQKK